MAQPIRDGQRPAAAPDIELEEPVEQSEPDSEPDVASQLPPEDQVPPSVPELLRRVDAGWARFRAAAIRFPSERLDEHLGEEGWTRKQMLAHIAAWHDLTADRVVQFINTGEPTAFDMDTDAFNATVARRAVGRTAGEVLKDVEATFNRLRRQLARLTEEQLSADDWWAVKVTAGNTFGHYEEHWADIWTPDGALGIRR